MSIFEKNIKRLCIFFIVLQYSSLNLLMAEESHHRFHPSYINDDSDWWSHEPLELEPLDLAEFETNDGPQLQIDPLNLTKLAPLPKEEVHPVHGTYTLQNRPNDPDDYRLEVKVKLAFSLRQLILRFNETSDREDSDRIDPNHRYFLELYGTGLELSAKLDRKIRSVVQLDLAHFLSYEEGDNIILTEDVDIEKFITNAYVGIRDVGGFPMAIIIGKGTLKFGLNDRSIISHTHWNAMKYRGGILGLTLAFDMGDKMELIDDLRLTLYEADGGDLQFNDEAIGLGIHVEKKFGQNVLLLLSYGIEDNTYLRSPENDYLNYNYSHSSTGTLSLDVRFNRDISGWTEVFFLENAKSIMDLTQKDDPTYFGTTVGVSVRVFNMTFVGSYLRIGNMVEEFGLGARLPPAIIPKRLRKNGQCGLQVYHSIYDEGISRTIIEDDNLEDIEHIDLNSDNFFGILCKWRFESKHRFLPRRQHLHWK